MATSPRNPAKRSHTRNANTLPCKKRQYSRSRSSCSTVAFLAQLQQQEQHRQQHGPVVIEMTTPPIVSISSSSSSSKTSIIHHYSTRSRMMLLLHSVEAVRLISRSGYLSSIDLGRLLLLTCKELSKSMGRENIFECLYQNHFNKSHYDLHLLLNHVLESQPTKRRGTTTTTTTTTTATKTPHHHGGDDGRGGSYYESLFRALSDPPSVKTRNEPSSNPPPFAASHPQEDAIVTTRVCNPSWYRFYNSDHNNNKVGTHHDTSSVFLLFSLWNQSTQLFSQRIPCWNNTTTTPPLHQLSQTGPTRWKINQNSNTNSFRILVQNGLTQELKQLQKFQVQVPTTGKKLRQVFGKNMRLLIVTIHCIRVHDDHDRRHHNDDKNDTTTNHHHHHYHNFQICTLYHSGFPNWEDYRSLPGQSSSFPLQLPLQLTERGIGLVARWQNHHHHRSTSVGTTTRCMTSARGRSSISNSNSSLYKKHHGGLSFQVTVDSIAGYVDLKAFIIGSNGLPESMEPRNGIHLYDILEELVGWKLKNRL